MNNEENKILIVPQDISVADIFAIKSGGRTRSILAADEGVFEVVNIVGSSPYDSVPAPQTPFSEPVKSILLRIDNHQGAVSQDPRVLVATRFNMTYFFAGIFNSQNTFSSRFQDASDLKDQLLDLDVISGWNDKIESEYNRSLNILCETIVEGDQTFYKYSKDQLRLFLKEKIEKLAAYIIAKKSLSLYKAIRSSLISQEEPPQNILEAQTLRFATDMVMVSYFDISDRTEMLGALGYESEELASYLKKVKSQNESENLQDTTVTTPRIKAKTKAPRKKESKVAVGKGALDSFFKSRT